MKTLACVFLLLAACAEPTAYVAAPLPGDEGYRVVHHGGDKFTVIFHANSQTDMQEVRDFCYRRAAEITLRNGVKTFVVTKKEEAAAGDGPTFSLHIQIDLDGTSEKAEGEEVDAEALLKKIKSCDENDWRVKNNMMQCPHAEH